MNENKSVTSEKNAQSVPDCLRKEGHEFMHWSKLVRTPNGVFQYRSCFHCSVVQKLPRGNEFDFNLSKYKGR